MLEGLKEGFLWLNEKDRISTGFAGLVASLMVAVGWWFTVRKEQYFHRINTAHDTFLIKNKKFIANLEHIKDWLGGSTQIPTHDVLQGSAEGKLQLKAFWGVLNELETLGLDISTGRASERYTRETQRTLICDIMLASQEHIEKLRNDRDQKGLFINIESLFIRLYFNHYIYIQRALEMIVGRPIFRYSYMNFRIRYLICCWALGGPWDYHAMPYAQIRKRVQIWRRVMVVFWFAAAILACIVLYMEL